MATSTKKRDYLVFERQGRDTLAFIDMIEAMSLKDAVSVWNERMGHNHGGVVIFDRLQLDGSHHDHTAFAIALDE